MHTYLAAKNLLACRRRDPKRKAVTSRLIPPNSAPQGHLSYARNDINMKCEVMANNAISPTNAVLGMQTSRCTLWSFHVKTDSLQGIRHALPGLLSCVCATKPESRSGLPGFP